VHQSDISLNFIELVDGPLFRKKLGEWEQNLNYLLDIVAPLRSG
jgi:hypothetical protein